MTKQSLSAKTRRELAARSTKASARLEHRVVPAEHVRSAEVERFVESLRSRPPICAAASATTPQRRCATGLRHCGG